MLLFNLPNAATINCNPIPNECQGTNQADTMFLTVPVPPGYKISGLGGSDTITAIGSTFRAEGGPGDDKIILSGFFVIARGGEGADLGNRTTLIMPLMVKKIP